MNNPFDQGVGHPSSIQDLVEAVASEMSLGIGAAVERWLGEVEQAIQNPRASALERVEAAKGVIARFRELTSKGVNGCAEAKAG